MKKILALVALVLFLSPLVASADPPCPKKRTSKVVAKTVAKAACRDTHTVTVVLNPVPAPLPCPPCGKEIRFVNVPTRYRPTSVATALRDGFSITSGFRWDRVRHDPALEPGTDLETNEDPFFVGASLNVPLTQWASIGGNFDRDIVNAPHWNARVFVALHPWSK